MVKNNPPCEYCGTKKYTYEELLFVDEEIGEYKTEYHGLYICPDCVSDAWVV